MENSMVEQKKIAIIGGGVAGVTTAIYLAQRGLNITLFEKEPSLVSGPPFCHLHAGGNLYREISDQQCITLLQQSIDFLNFYPYCVDYRPTVIALPTTDKQSPTQLLPRLQLLQNAYAKLIEENPHNQVLGESKNYFKLYSKEQIETLQKRPIASTPTNADEWMIPVAQTIDLEKVQFPLILVQEYGLNLFRLASGATLSLKQMKNVTLYQKTSVDNIENNNASWKITFTNRQTQTETFDYLINAAGFRTGKIDDMLDVPCKRMVEFKAAYVSQWKGQEKTLFPEIIFHGERGTPQGMGQFTPYPNEYFQLHGMTNNITLYDDGLVANTALSCQPELKQNFIEKIEQSWSEEETKERTSNAIAHLAQFIPKFSTATVGSIPLFGAQQIPGDDPTLRVAEVSFPTEYYARCEIVKVSSVIDMIRSIIKELIKVKLLNEYIQEKNTSHYLEKFTEEKLMLLAQTLAKERGYPSSLAKRNISYK